MPKNHCNNPHAMNSNPEGRHTSLPTLQVPVMKTETESSSGIFLSQPDGNVDKLSSRGESRVPRVIVLPSDASTSSAPSENISIGNMRLSPSSHLHSCPVCFGDYGLEEFVALFGCLHKFCKICIEKWSSVKRQCPLCKGEFNGWFQNIKSDVEFEEFKLPETEDHNSKTSNHLGAHTTLPWPYSARGPLRNYWPRRRNQVTRNTSLSRGGQASLSTPSPYYFRLQRGLQSSQQQTVGTISSQSSQQASDSGLLQEALRKRRRVYERGLRALPLIVSRMPIAGAVEATRRSADSLLESRQMVRVESWVKRELQASVADSSCDEFWVQLIMGVWKSYNSQLSRIFSTSRKQRGERDVNFSEEICKEDTSCVEEIERFLGSRASLFWHELKSFARSPYTMEAYDSVVKYESSPHSYAVTEPDSRNHEDRRRMSAQISNATENFRAAKRGLRSAGSEGVPVCNDETGRWPMYGT